MKNETKRNTLKSIQKDLFRSQLILIITLALFLGISGILINIFFETQKRDRNLENIAEAIAVSPILSESIYNKEDIGMLTEYLDSLRESLSDIDVISIVNCEGERIYHSNHSLIGIKYDGTIPKFERGVKEYYAANDKGPSGTQRRAYAAIYGKDGEYVGFVIAVMLMENIREQTVQTLFIFFLITLAAILMELMISGELSGKIKDSLLGYEPDVFSAMYQIRDNILETLDEGIIAIDLNEKVQFVNNAALLMLGMNESIKGGRLDDFCDGSWLTYTLKSGEKQFNLRELMPGSADILLDRIPVMENGEVVGAIGILHNRAEYTKLMEDLTGTRYLVDSMRANNHDFTNKLHVILGLIQMQMYEEAKSYIENITIVQRATISKIMNAVNEPAVAALLIGKVARASELNVKFKIREGCFYSGSDLGIPGEMMVSVIGNLIDNAFDAMNIEDADCNGDKELLFGIYSNNKAVLITVDDTGCGINNEDMEHIFENGFSTKGEGRGTGLYQVKRMVEAMGGTISVESQEKVGTSVSVSLAEKKKEGR